MSGKTASILTKTQRQRLKNGFEDLEIEKKRRDQQRIRERIKSGVFDYQHLTDYPDRQFELAFDDVSSDELESALADTYLVCERLRELHGIDRDELVLRARGRQAEISDRSPAIRTVEDLELVTDSELYQRAERDVHRQVTRDPWETRANTSLKVGLGAFVPFILMRTSDWAFFTDLLGDFGGVALLFGVLGMLCILFWYLVVVVHGIRDSIIPRLLTFVRKQGDAVGD